VVSRSVLCWALLFFRENSLASRVSKRVNTTFDESYVSFFSYNLGLSRLLPWDADDAASSGPLDFVYP
jgi:hypothetical protein